MYSESRKRKRLLDRLIDTRHHEDRSAAAAARRGLRLRFVTFDYPLLSLHKFLLLRLVKNFHFPNERSAPVADLVRVHGVLASSLVLSRRVMLLFFFFFGFGIRSFSRIFSRRLIRRGRLVGAVPKFFFFLLFFRGSRIRVDSFPDECSLFVDASSSHSRFLGGNVDYDVRCIQKGTRGR